MDEYRALLFTHAEISHAHQVDAASIRAVLGDRFNAAGDQPRWRLCMDHGERVYHPTRGTCSRYEWGSPCRVVDVIVCVLPEQP